MSDIFTKIPKKIPWGKILPVNDITSLTNSASISQMCAEYKTSLDTSINVESGIIDAFTVSPNLIADYELDASNAWITPDRNIVSFIDQDEYDAVFDGIKQISEDGSGVTITNENGDIFNVKISNAGINIDGNTTNLYCETANGDKMLLLAHYISQEGYRVNMFNNTVLSRTGRAYSIFSIISDLRNSMNLNKFLSDLCSPLINLSRSSLSAVSTILASGVSSSCRSVSNTATEIMRLFGSNGISGVVQAIANFIQAQLNLSSIDETLVLTDNSGYVPTVYLSGAIQVGIAIGTAVVGIVIAAVSKIAGLIFYATAAVIQGFASLVNTAYKNQYASLLEDQDLQSIYNDYVEYAGFQCENFPILYFPDPQPGEYSFKDWWIDNEFPLCYLKVPGGVLLIGKATNFDPQAPAVNFEFHPSLRATITPGASVNNNLSRWFMDILGHPIDVVLDQSTPGTVTNAQIMFGHDGWSTAKQENAEQSFQFLTDHYESAKQLQPAGSGDYQGYFTNDEQVRRSLAFNSLLFYSWYKLTLLGWAVSYTHLKMYVFTLYTHQWENIDSETIKCTITPDDSYFHGILYQKSEQSIGAWFSAINDDGKILTPQTISTAYAWDVTWYRLNLLPSSIDVETRKLIIQLDSESRQCCTWARLIKGMDALTDIRNVEYVSQDSSTTTGINIVQDSADPAEVAKCYYGIPYSVMSNRSRLQTPTVDWNKTVSLFILVAALAVIVTVATIATTVAFKRFSMKKRALNAAKIERNWADFVANPSDTTYRQYKKSVFKNNLWSRIIGGNTYSASDYWNGDPVQEDTDSGVCTTNPLYTEFCSLLSPEPNLAANQATISDVVALRTRLDLIFKILTGDDYNP